MGDTGVVGEQDVHMRDKRRETGARKSLVYLAAPLAESPPTNRTSRTRRVEGTASESFTKGQMIPLIRPAEQR